MYRRRTAYVHSIFNFCRVLKQMTGNVPETLPKDVLYKVISQFEASLKEEACFHQEEFNI